MALKAVVTLQIITLGMTIRPWEFAGVTKFYCGRLPRGDFSLWRWDQLGEQKVFP